MPYVIDWHNHQGRESRSVSVPVLTPSHYLPMTRFCSNKQFVIQEQGGQTDLRPQSTFSCDVTNGLYSTANTIGSALRLPTNSVMKPRLSLSMRPTLSNPENPEDPTFVAPFSGSIELKIPNSPYITGEMVDEFISELVAQFVYGNTNVIERLIAGNLDILR